MYDSNPGQQGIHKAFGYFLIVTGLMVVGVGILSLALAANSPIGLTLIGLICLAMGSGFAYVGYALVRSVTDDEEAEQSFTAADLEIGDDVLEPGESTAVELVLIPDGSTSILSAALRLVSYEYVVQNRNHPDDERRVVWHQERLQIPDLDTLTHAVADGKSADRPMTIEIPNDPEVHFGQTGPLDWQVQLQLDVHGAGEVRHNESLTVNQRALR